MHPHRRSTTDSLSRSTFKLYDSYIRAIKWASQRITDRGVIAYVTNGGWLDSNTADGMRLSLAEEFSSIYVYNLRGNQRTAGELSRKEGGKVFGGGSRATVAITLLVKDSSKPSAQTVHYADIGDYLSREQKLNKIALAGSMGRVEFTAITPNKHGDWINQRRDDFDKFTSVDAGGIFEAMSLGVMSGRDSWEYGSSASALVEHVALARQTYLSDLDGRLGRTLDPHRISWSASLERRFSRGERPNAVETERIVIATYRPFFRQYLYYDQFWIHQISKSLQGFFPPGVQNRAIYFVGSGSAVPFSVYVIESIPDLHVTGAGSGGQIGARFRFESLDDSGALDFADGEVIDGHRRIDNVTDEALERFRSAYGETITKDDIFYYVYGLLHSPEYRETYAADLRKMLPRIPLIEDAAPYVDAGRKLAALHLGYESVEPYPLHGLDTPATGDPYDFYRVEKLAFGKVREDGKLVVDKSTIKYNSKITLAGIPEDAYRYMLGSRSAVEWIIDRYQVKTDSASGIVNDPNDWSREVGDPRYIINLLARVVTVSLKTIKIVNVLPTLVIRTAQS